MTEGATRYKRVLLKISGEAFTRPGTQGVDINEVESIAQQLKAAHELNVQLAVVVGGGNIVRGQDFSNRGMHKATADQMGMLATVINSLALQDALERINVTTRAQTAITMQALAEPYIRRRCTRHLEKDRIVILAAGTGNPYFTTDTAAALRAIEIDADILLKATKVDGVYTEDPMKNPSAKRYDILSYMKILRDDLKVMDATAISLCRDNNLPIIVFDLKKEGNIVKAVRGERIGTLVRSESEENAR